MKNRIISLEEQLKIWAIMRPDLNRITFLISDNSSSKKTDYPLFSGFNADCEDGPTYVNCAISQIDGNTEMVMFEPVLDFTTLPKFNKKKPVNDQNTHEFFLNDYRVPEPTPVIIKPEPSISNTEMSTGARSELSTTAAEKPQLSIAEQLSPHKPKSLNISMEF